MQFEDIYRLDVIQALENDRELDFKDIGDKYLQKGVCPKCRHRSLYIARHQPFQLACNRKNNCQHEERTRERYAHLFENLSDRFPVTPTNPLATAEAYLQRARGFDTSKMQGWFTQGRRKLKNEEWAETVRFPLCNGYWERIIDARAVAANGGDKAGIKWGMTYKGQAWVPPGTEFTNGSQVFVVEGIFHAIALTLAGFRAVASISCNNFPFDLVQEHKGKQITWVIAMDDDNAGRSVIPKYRQMLDGLNELNWVALAGHQSNGMKRDWDDVYRDGKLNKEFMDDAIYRGRLFTAKNPLHMAYLLFIRRERPFYLFEHGSRLYSAKVAFGNLKEDLGSEPVEGNKATFQKHTEIDRVANCVPRFEYVEKDAITGEQRYFFRFEFPNSRLDCKEPLSPSSIAEPRGFAKAMLERTPGGQFDGGEKVLSMLKSTWLDNPNTVRTLPFVGYDEATKAYCYPQFGYFKGKRIEVNDNGFLDVAGDGLKTSSRNFHMARGGEFDPSWFDSFRKVFDLNGLAALAWWTGSLFAVQIRSEQASWPFLELTGAAGAGKSTLLRFLWRLVGRKDEEGIKPSGSGASAIGLLRALAGVSNLPVVLLESDKETVDSQGRTVTVQYSWDEIKALFDHNAKLRVIGVKTSGSDTDALIFRGAVCISQNTTVDGSEAIITRIVYLHMGLDHHSPELRPLAEQLKTMPVEDLAGYLDAVLKQESTWLRRYFEAYPTYEARFLGLGAGIHPRIIHCHAQVMAAAKATQSLFPSWSDRDMEALAKHMESRALDRQQSCSAENKTAAAFWQTYHYLNEQLVTTTDESGKTDSTWRETLNHSTEKGVIAINLNHFQQECKKAGQEVTPTNLLMRYLRQSRTYPFIETRKVHSRLERRTLNCWLFRRS